MDDRKQDTAKQRDRREQKMMWIFSGAIVLLILGAMGINMLFHGGSPKFQDTDVSAQSRTTPAPAQ
jgi:flagellar basal body-associated protein FliL